MSARRRRAGRGTRWWLLAAVLLGVAFVWWWSRVRRAETPSPPASMPGARSLANPPGGEAPPVAGADPAEDITREEKDELQRILRERGGADAQR